jgi:hypothetical protein
MLKLIILIIFLYGFQLYAQSLAYAREIVNTLSSTEYKGRGYTGKADLKSAEYIRNEFKKQGIQSLENNYFQHFYLNVNTFPGTIEVKLEDNILFPGIDYLVDPSSPTVKGKYEVVRLKRADLVSPGFLYSIIDSIEGRAVLIDERDTLKLNREDEELVNKLIHSIKYNPELKNSLTIILTNKKLTWHISTEQSSKPVITLKSVETDTKISEIKVNIKASFKKNYQTRNVIGMIRGTLSPDSFIVVTAHYDHLGVMGEKTIFPGANDNASGIAMLLNLSKYYAANPPEYSMVFLALSAEEAGLLGAQHFMKYPLFPTNKIRFLVNFDLAGTGDDGIKVVNATVFKKEFEQLLQINEEHNYLPSVQPRGEACISDHCIFYMNNVPCFYIYTLGGINAYHDIYDKPETLPLTEFTDYFNLMISFFNNLPK